MKIRLRRERFEFALTPNLELGAGGEGRVLSIPKHPKLVVKIYHKPTYARSEKLEAMIRNTPRIPMVEDIPSLIWPLDIVDRVGAKRSKPHIGFTMYKIQNMRPLFEFYNPAIRRKKNPLFNYRYLYRAARNLAVVVKSIHDAGHVIGDINESNIMMDNRACIAVIDTDSFQVKDSQTGKIFRCRVGKPEFTPPELQGLKFSEVDQNPTHDNYGLAILIFQILMEGIHPFAGIFTGAGDPPHINERIAAGHYPHGSRPVPYKKMPAMPPFTLLDPELSRLFDRCFSAGHKNPKMRPTASEWSKGIGKAESKLIACRTQPQHIYGQHLKSCPWCLRAKQFKGRDSFPSVKMVKKGVHRKSPVNKKLNYPVIITPKTQRKAQKPSRLRRFLRSISLQSTTPPGTRAMRRRRQMQLQQNQPPQQPLVDNQLGFLLALGIISGILFTFLFLGQC